MGDYVEFLKAHVLQDTVVHHTTLPARPRRLAPPLRSFPPAVADILQAAGVTSLYSHQAEGIGKALDGDNVVVATPTASGKTLVYNVPVITTLLENPEAHALYIFPLKALVQDQHDELHTLLQRLDRGLGTAVYDGDTPAHQRRQIRAAPPNVLITTPDMLHAGLLAFHEAWAAFFARLRYVVIDELHTYSGVFGTHVLHLLRRLNRVCAAYGSRPVYMTSSATIGNPEHLASTLANRPFHTVSDNGAPGAVRHVVFVNSPESPQVLAARLLRMSVTNGLRTIVFTRARVITELIYRSATQRHPELREVISSYRAGYLPEERRQIEAALHAGELLGVVSTSALELGIDIGNLDVCILVGYPGSIVNTWQRAGRVGRSGREALIILIAGRDALDQFLIKYPEHFLGRSVEDAVVDPANPYILKDHSGVRRPRDAAEPRRSRVCNPRLAGGGRRTGARRRAAAERRRRRLARRPQAAAPPGQPAQHRRIVDALRPRQRGAHRHGERRAGVWRMPRRRRLPAPRAPVPHRRTRPGQGAHPRRGGRGAVLHPRQNGEGNGNPGHPALTPDAGISVQTGAPQGALPGGGLREDSRARRRPAQSARAGIAGPAPGDHRLLAGIGAAIPTRPETARLPPHGLDSRQSSTP